MPRVRQLVFTSIVNEDGTEGPVNISFNGFLTKDELAGHVYRLSSPERGHLDLMRFAASDDALIMLVKQLKPNQGKIPSPPVKNEKSKEKSKSQGTGAKP